MHTFVKSKCSSWFNNCLHYSDRIARCTLIPYKRLLIVLEASINFSNNCLQDTVNSSQRCMKRIQDIEEDFCLKIMRNILRHFS